LFFHLAHRLEASACRERDAAPEQGGLGAGAEHAGAAAHRLEEPSEEPLEEPLDCRQKSRSKSRWKSRSKSR
jgi:hypothetical protein